MADEVVLLAFSVGLEASRRSALIDPSTGNWATLVPNISSENAEVALEAFNAEMVLEPSKRAFVSAQSPSSVTISGPPSTTKDLFSKAPMFQSSKRIPLPILAAFHANHLGPIQTTKIIGELSQSILGKAIQHRMNLSASTGQLYTGTTFASVLSEVMDDIFQNPICLQVYTGGLATVLPSQATLLLFGPVNCATAMKRSIRDLGVDLSLGKAIPEYSDATSDLSSGAIAIVGMSVRLPGSETLEEFWKVLEDGRDLHEKIRPDRFDVNTHYDSSGDTPNTTLTPYGVFIDRPGFFDTRLFNMSPREAAQTDPQQRLLLLTTFEALEMAGYTPNGTPSTCTRRIGSFIGQTSDDWREVNASQNIDTYFITGGIRAFGPGRLNYHFGWEGPSYSVDTACSSSAASIQLACSSLLARECDTAIGGGANLLTSSDLFAGLSRGSFLSKTGGCKTFDNDADGYVRADAVGVVVLKRLDDALKDRDNILAVLRAAVTNHSAEAVSITHPHAETQERLFDSALRQAGIGPHEIDYAEMHGTGTQAGDATESRSVTNVLSRGRLAENPLYIGSVKPNLGHGEAASGVTSLVKAILMLRKNMIPPHVGIKGRINQKLPPLADLNTRISFGKTLFVPRTNKDGKRRILINNFDAAGGNTSLIIEDPPVVQVQGNDPRNHHIVAVSGKTPNAILGNTKRLLEYLGQNHDARLEDVAYTTTARRMHHPLRQACVASSIESLVLSLEKGITAPKWDIKASVSGPFPVVFLFTGQGSQYSGMGSELFETSSSFRESLEEMDRICVSHGFDSFLDLITGNLDTSKASPVQVQLAIVSVELALAAWWKRLGITPTVVLGHSLGEYPALCTAGVISLSDCLYLVGKRAMLMMEKCGPGTHSMLAIQASEETAKSLMNGFNLSSKASCEISCVNGPASIVVSGPVDRILEFQTHLHSHRIKSTLLDVQYAFHSSQMDPLQDGFSAVLGKVHFAAPRMPIASTVLGKLVTEPGVIDARYLSQQMRRRVEFLPAVKSIGVLSRLDAGQQKSCLKPLWIETGPHPTCLGLARSVLGEKDQERCLPSLKRNESDWKVLATSVAKAYNAGLDIKWRHFHKEYEKSLRLLELPHYAFDLKNYWIQYEGDWAIRKGRPSTQSKLKSLPSPPSFSTTSLHRIESEVNNDSEIKVVFATEAKEPKLNKALRGHLVNGAGLCPSSVYADMAFTAADYLRNLSGLSGLDPQLSMDVRDMHVHKPLLIRSGDTQQIIRVTATLKRSSNSPVEVEFSSQDGEIHQDHAHCIVSFDDGDAWRSDWSRSDYLVKSRIEHLIESSIKGQTHRILRPMAYKLFASLVDYDIRYQGMQEVYMDSNLLEAAAVVRFNTTDADGSFTYSPYWIDSFAHLSGFVLNSAETTPRDTVYISHGWKSMKIVGRLSAEKSYQSYVRMQETKARGIMAGDVYLFEGEKIVALCQELKFQRIKRSMLNHLLPPSDNGENMTGISTTPALQSNPPQQREGLGSVTQSVTPPKPQPRSTGQPEIDDILEIVASEIGVDTCELTSDSVFADLGVDSLLSISITAKLGKLLNAELPATLFTQYLTVDDLRGYFDEHFNDGDGMTALDESSDSDVSLISGQLNAMDTPLSITGYVPGTPAESPVDLVRKIIAEEVGVEVDEIDQDTPLVDFGVDSLLSLSIVSAIKSKTGRVLPSTFLIENPTMGAIQSALDALSAAPSSHTLAAALESVQPTAPDYKATAILLQGSTSAQKPFLFLLPDGSGSASSYVGLPRLHIADKGGAVYGLDSPFLHAPENFNVSLREAATMYVAEIRRLQPRGPYRLAGWSIGGTYAFEAVSQLVQRHGETVDSLTLIDAPCPKRLPPLNLETIELLENVDVFDGLGNNKDGTKKKVSTPAEAVQKIRAGVQQHFAGSVNALGQYQPEAISKQLVAGKIGAVKVVWARHGVWETVGDAVRAKFKREMMGKDQGTVTANAARDWIMDPRSDFGPNGWDELLPGADIECEVITGDHFSIMRKPGVLELGRFMN